MEIHADFWPGQRLSKKLFGRRGLYVSFSTAGLHPGSWINRLSVSREKFHVTIYGRKQEFYGVICRCFARVKCGDIMSGFEKCCDCRESHLLCDLPKVLTDKSQVCAVELVLLERSVWNTDCGLRTTDCGLGIKNGLGIKCGLRTEYKTRTGYKTRTTDYVNKNSFRKVKLREMESGLAKTVVPALTFPRLFT